MFAEVAGTIAAMRIEAIVTAPRSPHHAARRLRVVNAYEAGEGSDAMLAKRFVLGSATVTRWVAQRRRVGHVDPRPKAGGTPSPVSGAVVDALIAVLGDPTAGELTAAYNRGRSACTSRA